MRTLPLRLDLVLVAGFAFACGSTSQQTSSTGTGGTSFAATGAVAGTTGGLGAAAPSVSSSSDASPNGGWDGSGRAQTSAGTSAGGDGQAIGGDPALGGTTSGSTDGSDIEASGSALGSGGAATGGVSESGGTAAGGTSGFGGTTDSSGSGGATAGGTSGSVGGTIAGTSSSGSAPSGGAPDRGGVGGVTNGGLSDPGGGPSGGAPDPGGAGGEATAGAAGSQGTPQSSTAVENASADCTVAALPDPAQLPTIPKFPDPFQKLDGTPIAKRSEWHCRRQEIRKQAEKYIYGEKPEPDLVTGSVTRDRITVHVEDEGKEIEFSADVVLPTGEGPFPAIINVGAKGGFGGISLGESRILEQGVAVIYYDHYRIGAEGTPEASRGQPNPGFFYDIYGGDHSAGLLLAWAWGASRLIDVLQASGGEFIDSTGLGVTGCSRNGKGAFAIGVFDDRIALTIPQETSTAGVPAYRIVDILGKERTDHNYYGLNWLSNDFEPFVFSNGTSNAVKLPLDTHTLIGMIAPRGLLVLENPHQAQMGAPAGHAASVAGREIYKALGVEGAISYHSDVSDTAHCSYKTEYTGLLVQNIQRFLKHEGEEPGRFEVGANGSLDTAEWITWPTPTLENDTPAGGTP